MARPSGVINAALLPCSYFAASTAARAASTSTSAAALAPASPSVMTPSSVVSNTAPSPMGSTLA